MPQLLTTWRGTVIQDWVDYNGHLRDAYYLLLFSYASDGLMDTIGLDAAGRAATGHTLYSLEVHLNYLQEVKEGTAVEVRTQILAVDHKRLNLYHTLHPAGSDTVLAANEQMLINIATEHTKSTPFAPHIQATLDTLATAHANLPRPAHAGRRIGMTEGRG